MIEWLTDTLVMTGVLMALVLLVRRPVSRWFGPAAAYALWALPVLRLILPPLALPRGIFARPEISVQPITAAAQSQLHVAQTGEAASAALPNIAAPASPVLHAEPGLLAQIPWFELIVAVWLIGAALFLVSRFRNYRRMRRELLQGSYQVARAGEIRIIETPGADAPLAFGVKDRVVALPCGFLATVDSESSDFAIAHELEHHAGNDLLALMVLQPLFALHWFNPLGWAAWRALRADQEAACDARVMAGCNRETRARYGRVIASFAAGTRLTLAAPIAGALAGEKPIIQRLKALATLDVSPLRRVMARSLFAAAVVAVPCTATVTYAAMEEEGDESEAWDSQSFYEDDAQAEVPVVPAVAPVAVPAAPQAPAAPISAAVTPQVEEEAPVAPVPPAPPAPAPWSSAAVPVPPAPPAPPPPPSLFARERLAAERRAAAEDYRATVARAMRTMPRVEQSTSANGKVQTIRIVRKDDGGRRRIEKTITIDSTCPADRQRSSSREEGSSSTYVCTGAPRQAMNAALQAISSARASVAANTALDAGTRDEIVAELDRELADTRAEMLREAN
ncbi:MAG: antirepressor regulating drug resistance protein [Novosphingobium pentaromativorans]|uniref:Antirepressor regulating drug resistance protein n=1 Tax=Novosphingobium pentaromativorans TaxID=205844 RepID=A0A2W5QZY8_9SPHN|nr:M56 family metallopeptidase [Novosphingobium panipatense]PZQ56910.1 MAG: antirepressor regulating drug resistance protein [Novosphingobium pentaromativorans]